MAGYESVIAEAVAVGIMNTAETIGDTSLAFEIERAAVQSVSYDFAADTVVFSAILDTNVAGTIYEMGLWSHEQAPNTGDGGSRLLVSFDSDEETWDGAASFSATNARIGANGLLQSPTLSSTVTNSMTNIFYDLSENSAADTFLLAVNATNAFTANVKVKFMVDVSNYYLLTFTGISTGYNVKSLAKSAATTVGTPNWNNITEIDVSTTATSGGTAGSLIDGLRIEDKDLVSSNYVLIDRSVLSTPFVKEEGRIQEIEFALPVTL
jgi:hypothetical protein